ncbi:DUF551 domain-containing protein [Oscillibacter sp.]|uniref:DUF551 domain-containing protein n=1 Tax=Oscillibacter sp. TaxID=1945593 RepID=UPI00289BB8FC|nr:DUF551 domain-containing protein [Oscillibacter sp.]
MDRLSEIRARYTPGNSQFLDVGKCTVDDISFLLAEVERLTALRREVVKLAQESVRRDIELAKLEVEVQAAQASNRWIPVGERLPERGERVIAYSPAMGGTEAEIQISKGFMLHSKRTDITHWRPLPEPPKGE